jgi:hypothetical protein
MLTFFPFNKIKKPYLGQKYIGQDPDSDLANLKSRIRIRTKVVWIRNTGRKRNIKTMITWSLPASCPFPGVFTRQAHWAAITIRWTTIVDLHLNSAYRYGRFRKFTVAENRSCTLWEMGMQEKVIHGFTYIMQWKIPWNDAGKTVSQHITKFSVLLLSTFQCQIIKKLYIHIKRKN